MREPVIHELVHYLDYFRASFEEYKDGEYYNAPEEFNAYYLQIASGVYKALENIKNKYPNDFNKFEETITDNASNFIKKMWNVIEIQNADLKDAIFKNSKYKYKWAKRLYQLYFEIRDKFITKKMTEQIKNDIKTKYFD